MKPIRIRFEEAPTQTDIEVVVRASARDEEVEALLGRIALRPPEKLLATGADGALARLDPEEVILIAVSGNVARLETERGSFTLRQTLQSLERSLAGGPFLRISRSELINLDKTEKYDFTIRGELRIELTGGIETWVARRFIPEVRRRIAGKEA